MSRREPKQVGPSPIPDRLYIQRQLPVKKVAFWFGRVCIAMSAVAVLLFVFIAILYRSTESRELLFWFSKTLPLPALKVNGAVVNLDDYSTFHNGMEKLYFGDGSVENSDDKHIGSLIDHRIVQNLLLHELVAEYKITLSDEQFNDVYLEFVNQYPSEAHLIESIDRRFGWTRDEFFEFIVVPFAEVRALDDHVRGLEDAQRQPRETIQDLHAKIFSDADSFGEFAGEVSTSLSASDGGELGLRPITEYPSEAMASLDSINVYELTAVIETNERFVIYQLIERQETALGILVNARELAVDKRNIHDVLLEREASANIVFYLQ